MKLSELRPCDSCNGPLTGSGPIRHATWYVIRATQAMVSTVAANQVMGLHQIFQGRAFGLAEAMAPNADGAVVVMGDQEPKLMTELFICMDCAMNPPHGLAFLIEKRSDAEEKKRETE